MTKVIVSKIISYNTPAFLTAMFCKFGVDDPSLRTLIGSLYSDLIDTILQKVPEDKKIVLFKDLLESVKISIEYYRSPGDNRALAFASARSLVEFNKKLIKETNFDREQYTSFKNILDQVFIDDLACDIGDLAKQFRLSSSLRHKIELYTALTVKIADYNSVSGTLISPRDILKPSSPR